MPVLIRVDEGDHEEVHKINRPASGGTASFVVTRELALGPQTVIFEIGDSEQTIEVEVRAADIILEPLRHTVTGDGIIDVPVKVTNQGDLAADAITVSANWMTSQPDSEDADSGQPVTVAVVGRSESWR